MKDDHCIRDRVLRALALNRTPGFHFPGNFLELSFDQVAKTQTRLSLEVASHCADAQGEADIAAVAVLADFALGTAIRANLDPATRLGTVSMTLELGAGRRTSPVGATSRFHGFVGHGDGRIGRSRVVLDGPAGEIGTGSGSFMVLKPPPRVELHPPPMRKRGDPAPAALVPGELAPAELRVLQHAEAAAARAGSAGEPFLQHFWGLLPERTADGASCTMANGPHVGNRVGHVQGGVLLALAAATANAGVAPGWILGTISCAFIAPGEGPTLRAHARVVHRGQRLAVLRTEVMREDGRRVLDAISTHLPGSVPGGSVST